MEKNVFKDERFAHIAEDPRFKKLPKKERKIKIDKRFKPMFENDRFKVKYSVDKRGRPISLSSKENLKKYYEVSSSDDDDDDDDSVKIESNKKLKKKKNITEEPDILDKVKNKELPSVVTSSSESDSDDMEENNMIDRARGEGNISSSSDDDSSSEDDDDGEYDHQWGELDADTERSDEVSYRLAACNLDWDRIKALDLLVLFNSFKPVDGIIKSVKIYPSEYGIQRLKEEQMHGPKELVDKNQNPENEHNDGAEYHMEKLRKYQLNRLKYYYAVIECDNKETANQIYVECDGLEYEGSATRLDLRFIPDHLTFEEELKSSADTLPEAGSYEPSQFVTTALQQAKVNLTWDETHPDRKKMIEKAFDVDDIADHDLKAYLASSSDESDVDDEDNQDDGNRFEHKDSISKYKALLNEINQKEIDRDKEDIEMEVSWEPGLKESTEKAIKNKSNEDVSTPWGKYLEKRRDKKVNKLNKMKSSDTPHEEDQPFSDDEIPSDIDLNDPYFAEEYEKLNVSAPKSNSKKIEKKSKDKNAGNADDEKSKAELELLMMDETSTTKHFNMKTIIENETKGKKNKNKKNKKDNNEMTEDFEIDVKDPRFNALYTSHHFNIDPSDQLFKKTKAMEAIVNEKQRRHTDPSVPESKKRKVEEKSAESSKMDTELSMLIKSVKSKAVNFKKVKRKKL